MDQGVEYGGKRQASPAPIPDRTDVFGRLLEVAVCLVTLAFLAPLLLIISALVWSHDGGPVLYGQARIGRNGRSFKCLSFRSLAPGTNDRLTAFLQAAPQARRESRRDYDLRMASRLTPIGRFLRQSGIDTLPLLLNVVKGDMSLVGPKPIVAAEIADYGRYFATCHSVRPGLIGLWRLVQRDAFDVRRAVAADVFYVRRRSLWLNTRIMAGALAALLSGRHLG